MVPKLVHSRPAEATPSAAVCVARLTDVPDGEQPICVELKRRAGQPLAARSLLSRATLRLAMATSQSVAIAFEEGDESRPIVMGIFQEAGELGNTEGQAQEAAMELPLEPLPADPVDARVDGKHVVLEGSEQVTLRCGEASIELRKDGKLIIRGMHVVSHAAGVNRIRGGTVQIN